MIVCTLSQSAMDTRTEAPESSSFLESMDISAGSFCSARSLSKIDVGLVDAESDVRR